MIGTKLYKSVFTNKEYADCAVWCNQNNATIEDMGAWYEVVALSAPTFEERIEAAYQLFDSNVEARLDAFAATRRYNSIYTAKAAKDSHIAKYAAEGQYCELMWGETYNKCDQLLAEYMPDVLAGKRPIPTWEEIEAQLPVLQWPDERVEEPTVTTEEITEQEPTYIPNEVTNASN